MLINATLLHPGPPHISEGGIVGVAVVAGSVFGGSVDEAVVAGFIGSVTGS